MPKYIAQANMTISVFTVVEAKNMEEARAKAQEAPIGTLVHQAFCDDAEDAWITEELDGEPEITSIRRK